MIKIISGTYGGRDGIKTVKDAPFSLTDAEEARLVDRGVAEYVYEQTSGNSVNLPAYDISMTEKQLRGLAAYYGIDVSKVKGKKNIVAAMDEFFKEQEDDEDPDGGADPDQGGDPEDPEDDPNDGEPEDPDAPKLGAEEPEA